MRIALLIGAAIFASLAYSVYEPMPEYVRDRAFLTVGHALMRLLDFAGRIAERLGICEQEVVRRSLFTAMLPPPKNSSDVVITYEQFANSRTVVFRPTKPNGSGLIYLHGGGWVVGSPEMLSQLHADLAASNGLTIFAVRYRLAPEHKFPGAFEDCLSATEAIFNSAKSLGLDPSRIGIAGDSVGGQLTASVVQQLSRSGSPHQPKLHLMVYPVTQVANMLTKSMIQNSDAPILKAQHMRRFVQIYLTGSSAGVDWIARNGHVTDTVRAAYESATGQQLPAPTDAAAASYGVSDSVVKRIASLATDYRVSPLLAEDLDKLRLPPAYIVASEFDPILDDAVMYASRLQRAGVRTQLREFRTYHGAMSLPLDGVEIRAYIKKLLLDELS